MRTVEQKLASLRSDSVWYFAKQDANFDNSFRAVKIFDQIPDMEAVIVPIGGGGLISGVAFAIKQIKPDCKVYGVQAQKASSMFHSKLENKRIELKSVNTFADGTAVKLPGELTFEFCQKYVDKIVTVSEDEIAAALLTLMEKEKIVSEGSGALSVAAVMFNKIPLKGKNIVCVVSGGNIDVNILSRVINRALLKTGRISNLTIELLDSNCIGSLNTVVLPEYTISS